MVLGRGHFGAIGVPQNSFIGSEKWSQLWHFSSPSNCRSSFRILLQKSIDWARGIESGRFIWSENFPLSGPFKLRLLRFWSNVLQNLHFRRWRPSCGLLGRHFASSEYDGNSCPCDRSLAARQLLASENVSCYLAANKLNNEVVKYLHTTREIPA